MDQEHDPRVFSTIADPERLAYFFAWSYTYPPPCPYWTTIVSSQSVSVPGGLVVGPYAAGKRMCKQGSEQEVYINNKTNPIIFVNYDKSDSSMFLKNPKISKYVFVDDLRPWPGRPSYYFYE